MNDTPLSFSLTLGQHIASGLVEGVSYLMRPLPRLCPHDTVFILSLCWPTTGLVAAASWRSPALPRQLQNPGAATECTDPLSFTEPGPGWVQSRGKQSPSLPKAQALKSFPFCISCHPTQTFRSPHTYSFCLKGLLSLLYFLSKALAFRK